MVHCGDWHSATQNHKALFVEMLKPGRCVGWIKAEAFRIAAEEFELAVRCPMHLVRLRLIHTDAPLHHEPRSFMMNELDARGFKNHTYTLPALCTRVGS